MLQNFGPDMVSRILRVERQQANAELGFESAMRRLTVESAASRRAASEKLFVSATLEKYQN